MTSEGDTVRVGFIGRFRKKLRLFWQEAAAAAAA